MAPLCLGNLPFARQRGCADWYVGPRGEATGTGTKESPWDIESALLGKHPVKPGDTIYILAGTYRRRPQELFEVKLAGTEDKPIHVRPLPGERATIDGGLSIQEPSAHLWIWELEILVSEPQPDKPLSGGSHPPDLKRPWGGLNVYGSNHCKYINLVIHECCQGVSFWTPAKESELYGCIIHDNGWPAVDRGHGHAIYTQNDDGIKTIADCILTGGNGWTMHAYGSAKADVNNFLIQGNIAYNGGPFLVGGGKPSKNIRVLDNYLYGVPMQIGYSAPFNEDCEIRNNLIVNGTLSINKYKKAVNEGNIIVAKADARPAGVRVIIRPNKYDTHRANVAVYNWDRKPNVAVDPGDFLTTGTTYRLMNPRDFFGKPILAGTYEGKPIDVPMAGEFAAFVMLKDAPKP